MLETITKTQTKGLRDQYENRGFNGKNLMPGPGPKWKGYQAEDTVYECGEFLAGPSIQVTCTYLVTGHLPKQGWNPKVFSKEPTTGIQSSDGKSDLGLGALLLWILFISQ